jgi:outer membrane PBP1 activator LpoA protein
VLQEREERQALAGDWLAAAETLFQRSHTRSGSRQDEAVSDRLFGYLLRLDTATLAEASRGARDPDWRQWLEMQVVYREGPEALAAWMNLPNALPQRPAMPRHVTRWVTAESVDHIALLLPLEGRLAGAGEAVLSGAIDQLYTLFPDPSSRPALTTLNSAQPAGVRDLYRQAVADGADLIIGPLIKEDVASLVQLAQRTVPVIALNQTDSRTGSFSRNWMSLSLAPEDEARQIADVAFGRACRHAIVVGLNSDRGARLLSSFTDRWTQHGGRIRGQLVVDKPADTNAEMGKLLGSGSSDQRIRAVESAFDLPVDARGRGRSDFECIFMLAPDAATARTWRPLLVFHMTGDVPVYATSAINDGVADTRNRDLNGVVFVEAPAMLPPEMTDRLSRLRALGRDAMTLAQHWQQTTETGQWVVRGQTGLLRRKQDGSVERELELATFDGARIRLAALP